MTDAPSGVNYSSNSKKKKEAEAVEKRVPRVEKKIEGVVIERKKPLGQRIKAAFNGDDSRSVGQFILFEIVVPAIKQLVSDAVSQGTERLLFGDSVQSRRSSRPGYTAYNRVSTSRKEEPRVLSRQARATHDFREIILESRGEADGIIVDLMACIDEYDVATVSDLYDLVGITGSFQDDKWGWYDLKDARVSRVREGYLVDLPRTQPIE